MLTRELFAVANLLVGLQNICYFYLIFIYFIFAIGYLLILLLS